MQQKRMIGLLAIASIAGLLVSCSVFRKLSNLVTGNGTTTATTTTNSFTLTNSAGAPTPK